jgi:hypothetical protein
VLHRKIFMKSVRFAGDQLLNALTLHDWDGIRRAYFSDYIHHAPGVPQVDLEKYIATLQLVVAAVPDMSIEIQQIVATDEYATLRYTVHGTHALVTRITFDGTRATGVEIVYEGKTHRIRSGREVVLSLGAIHTPKG